MRDRRRPKASGLFRQDLLDYLEHYCEASVFESCRPIVAEMVPEVYEEARESIIAFFSAKSEELIRTTGEDAVSLRTVIEWLQNTENWP